MEQSKRDACMGKRKNKNVHQETTFIMMSCKVKFTRGSSKVKNTYLKEKYLGKF